MTEKMGPVTIGVGKLRTRGHRKLKLHPRRPRGRPKTADLEALEARLVSVARQAFVMKGYGATSINEVARSARVSKNTLYSRFPSKAALLQAIVARQIANVGDELRSMSWEEAATLHDRLCAYLTVALSNSLTSNVLEINRLIMSESYQFPELAELAWNRFRRGVDHIALIIAEFAARDHVRCREPLAAAELLMYAVYGWYNSVVISNRVVTDAQRNAWVEKTVKLFMASRPAW